MHFYTQQGQPCYTVPKANGQGERDCHIGDARKLSLVPGTTDPIKLLAKHHLVEWQMRQALEFIEKNPQYIGMPVSELRSLFPYMFKTWDKKNWTHVVVVLANEEGKKYSKRGTEIHDKLELFYKDEFDHVDADYNIIIAVDDAIKRIVKNPRPEVAFSHPLGFGGKVDLVGTNCILDFKTRQNETFDKKSVYDEYVMQLAAYRLGLKMPLADCYNVLISVTKPGVVYVHKWAEEEIQRGEKMFRAMLEYWKLVNKYDSSYEEKV